MNRIFTAIITMASVVPGCASKGAAAPASSHHVHADEAGVNSVRPGVNDKYREAGSVELWAGRFEDPTRDVVEHRDEIVTRLAITPGDVVADIGAGTGLFTAALSAAVGSGGRLIATDITPAFLDRLRERAATLPNVEVRETTARGSALEPATVDVAVLVDVYHHLEFPGDVMASIRDALREGGTLVVVDFRRIEGTTSPGLMKHIRADQATVQSEIEAAGFELVEALDFLDENYFMRFRARRDGPR